MSALFRFESGAREEYQEAIRYYAAEAIDPKVARRFVTAFESAVSTICSTPELWRIAEPPDLRRYVLRRFPFVLYYRFLAVENMVVIYAVMHTSRKPGYWRRRL